VAKSVATGSPATRGEEEYFQTKKERGELWWGRNGLSLIKERQSPKRRKKKRKVLCGAKGGKGGWNCARRVASSSALQRLQGGFIEDQARGE